MHSKIIPTKIFDTYWRFAVERQEIFFRRQKDPIGPWTSDPILTTYRFTNAYRVCDRVSQYLVREVQYGGKGKYDQNDLFFRTLLFKLFNRIETWEAIERSLGEISWRRIKPNALVHVLDDKIKKGVSIYSAAYIMPSPPFGYSRKHQNHIALLARMMDDRLPDRIAQAPSLRAAYEMLRRYPGLGPFLAFQYTIDLNYSELLNFDEKDFVVAGPGALDGIAKCFSNIGPSTAEEVIYSVAARQGNELKRLGLQFKSLYGRPLQPIDCQNLFCEISKYARVAHPDVPGIAMRRRIKQKYRPDRRQIAPIFLPPKWRLKPPPISKERSEVILSKQGSLL